MNQLVKRSRTHIKPDLALTKKSLSASILAGLFALGATTSEAVHVSPDGVGQVLIYPYYTVRSPKGSATDKFDTYISISNKTDQTKAVKVRFREGRRGEEVLDFNLFLSPRDMWTGAVVLTPNGAMLISNDKSCTVPNNLFALKDPTAPLVWNQITLNVFKNYRIDGSTEALDRTREGYFEVIEMGVVTDATQKAAAAHTGAAGVPANCGLFQTLNMTLGTTLLPPAGGLFGRASLVSPTTGSNFTYDATALAQWSDVVKYTADGHTEPQITDASPPVSRVMTDQGVVQATWAKPEDAVSAVLMHRELSNEFVLDSVTLSGTDWVVTFPTQLAYVQPGYGKAKAPFQDNYKNGSCKNFNFRIFDREELKGADPFIYPTLPPNVSSPTFCWASNVISFQGKRQGIEFNSNLLGTANVFPFVPIYLSPFDNINGFDGWLGGEDISRGFSKVQNGWGSISFDDSIYDFHNPRSLFPVDAKLLKLDGTVSKIKGTHYGLPVVGFMVHDYINGAVPGSSFGGLLNHKTSTEIDMTVVP